MQRFIISGLSGGSGKTIVSLGLTRFFTNQEYTVFPFKKGPDYIDSTWLMYAAHKPSYCLDPYFLDDEELYAHFYHCTEKAPQKSLAIIEGNRGIFDGKDEFGSCSTAQVAHILDCPVLLTINCAKMTRTTAAIILGIQHFDPKLNLVGIILNNTASERHSTIIQKSIELYTDIPVLGIIPRQIKNPIPERHMGLTIQDSEFKEKTLNNLAQIIADNINTKALFERLPNTSLSKPKTSMENIQQKHTVNIAYLYDEAFWFYYQENLDALAMQGAKLFPLSLLAQESFDEQLQKQHLQLSDIDAFYFGGGYPELYAEQISNSPKLKELKELVEKNFPIYAECGGFMLCSKSIQILENGVYKSYPMIGIFDIETKFQTKPQGLGYTEAQTITLNPYHPINQIWKGHEFHFSTVTHFPENQKFLLSLTKGHGMVKNGKAFDGVLYKNCYASYMHLYAPAVPHWAKNFVKQALEYQEKKHEQQ